ncbi:MAG: hypothetical protein SLAVMIC_01035 [uncultured marine phage]|uniref:Uncharacterized protein n=1 Tax=uncultured marine phage TaxID=707152 RepID=A0A8D9FSM1_9VIRU|nr:MAG: hypothetical protein SLAVMIC_01035 [uncultured marine phage]
MGRLKRTFQLVDRLNKPRPFCVMNRDARYYKGMKSCDIMWTDDQKQAKVFDDPNQIKHLTRWKPEEKMEIIYKDEF